MTITVESLRNPTLKSGYNHVRRDGVWGFRAQGGPRRARVNGPRRDTAAAAAADYVSFVNGDPTILDHKARAGRPDWAYLNGVLHRDLPGQRRGTLRHPKRGAAQERDLILRMTPTMAGLMTQHGDIAEAKASASRQAVVTGVGQLLLRWHELTSEDVLARMWLVLPESPSDVVQEWLRELGIVLVVEGE